MDSPRSESAVDLAVGNALSTAQRVVLAVSGGLDSMVLLEAASTVAPARGIPMAVATFDHGTGKAATAAVRLVRQRSADLGLECFSGRATRPLPSEAAFREARWRFLRDAADRFGPGTAIATAHTLDDQIETVLMRVMRGAGARGLAGLFARTAVLRPLLSLRRAELEGYAAAHGVSWVDDPSNATPRFARNRVRHDILPALRRASPAIDASLLTVAREAARWRAAVDAVVDRELGVRMLGGSGLDVPAARLAEQSPAVLAMIWPAVAARAGVSLDRRGIARLAAFSRSGRVGSRIQLSGGWEVTRSRDAFQLRASQAMASKAATTLAMGASERWREAWSFHTVESDRMPADTSWAAWLPAEPVPMVRGWVPGDVMTVRSGQTPVSVKRLLSRAGVTGHDRRQWPVVVAGGRILWIPGVCRSDADAAWRHRSGLPFVCEYHAS